MKKIVRKPNGKRSSASSRKRPSAIGKGASSPPPPSTPEARDRWTVRVRGELVERVNRAALYGFPRVTVSEILEAAIEAELARRELAIPAGAPLVPRGEIPRGRIPTVGREATS